jgi:hypothetical protein
MTYFEVAAAVCLSIILLAGFIAALKLALRNGD